jgi:hypothetical protein
MCKFEIGHKAVIKRNLKELELSNEHLNIWSGMVEMEGKEVTITDRRITDDGPRYQVDDYGRYWPEECFEDPQDETDQNDDVAPYCFYCGCRNTAKLMTRKGVTSCIRCINEMRRFYYRTEKAETLVSDLEDK